VRYEAPSLFLPGDGAVAAAVQQAARELTAMAGAVPVEAPWEAPCAAEWDRVSLHEWLSGNVGSVQARRILAMAFEGVFASNTTRTSLLAALFWARSGDPLTPFVATVDPGPERRFVGGAQQLSLRMAEELGDRVLLGMPVMSIEHCSEGVIAETVNLGVRARRAIVTLPPALCGRIRYVPAMPRDRDHLCQRVPMRWVIKVHCLYPSRFWAAAGLSGAVTSDAGIVRVCVDNSPPSGFPGVLVGFIEEAEAVRLADLTAEERRTAVLSDLARYFGETARRPLEYREHDWGADEFSRGADGGYWQQGVWTTYGGALRRPVGPLHWAGTETSPVWNGKMEGAILSGVRAADEVFATL
jgi:monoamine oxidase